MCTSTEEPTPIHQLPAGLSCFVGRAQELFTLRQCLHDHRLVTLTGTGGIGKTRLALAAAAAERAHFVDGVCLVELASLVQSDLVLPTIARALAVPLSADRAPIEQLVTLLQPKQLLLLLDNCEHLLEEAARLAAVLLTQCPRLTLLTTSREPLVVGGELVVRVPGLSVPNPTHAGVWSQLLDHDALRLFVERAQAAEPAFQLTVDNADAVAEICRRLDGIPLALELAAVRVRGMGVHTLAARLDQRFRLLIGGDRTAPPRQQTLRATVDWSYDLLSVPEQVVLRRLALFAGDVALDAAEQVCGGAYRAQHAQAELTPDTILHHLVQLVNKSLVHCQQTTGRYQLLETIRLFGREQLAEAGEIPAVSGRHLAWCLQLAEAAAPQLAGPDQALWAARLEAEHDNLRAALAWAIDTKQAVDAARLGLALWRFWHSHTYQREGLDWLEQLLALDAVTLVPPALRPRLLFAAGVLANSVCRFAQASAYQAEALRLWRATDDQVGVAEALCELGWQQFDAMHLQQAYAYATESVELARAVDHRLALAGGLHLRALSVIEGEGGDTNEMARHAVLRKAIGDLEEALTIWRAVGDRSNQAKTMSLIARAEAKRGHPEQAGPLLCIALSLFVQVGNYIDLQGALVALLNLALDMSNHPEGAHYAAQVAGVMVAREERLGGRTAWAEADGPFQQNLGQLAAMLGPERFAQALEAGNQLTIVDLVALAEAITVRIASPDPPRTPPPAHASLTAREAEVLRLVTAGLTNRQVAEQLHITARTVNAHLTTIYGKLGVSSRAGAMRYAFDHHLS